MKATEITKDIFWVGAVDFSSMDFHGYSLSPRGTSYNSYLLKDEKVVLFDTVKTEFFDTMVTRLKSQIEPEKIDYIVVNHVELDHSGALQKMVALCKPEKIFCSTMGKKAMEAHFDTAGWPIQVVKDGETLNVGKRNITFMETRMLHWPDSMFSYIAEDKLLISNDAFGQNIATTALYSDEIERSTLDYALSEYYHNIVLPFSAKVLSVLEAVAKLGLEIDIIAPDHGVIFRKKDEVQHVLQMYQTFAEQKTKPKALIIFDTMWHSTEKMAYAIADGLKSVGVDSRIMNLKQHHHSIVMTELAHCGLIIAGSPTHNNTILPLMAGMLTYMKGLKPKNRIGAAFGSYGWSGEAAGIIQKYMEEMGFDTPVEPKKHLFVPKADDLKPFYEMGEELGKALLAKVNG